MIAPIALRTLSGGGSPYRLSVPRGGRRVQAVCDWVCSHVTYQSGSTDATTTAMDTAVVRLGVCRDFALLVTALCRGLGIPARYVSGYALGLEPFDFHAFAQVYVGGRWYNVDATFDGVRPALIPIAVGRDAADVAMTTFLGPSKLKEQKLDIRKRSDCRGRPAHGFLTRFPEVSKSRALEGFDILRLMRCNWSGPSQRGILTRSASPATPGGFLRISLTGRVAGRYLSYPGSIHRPSGESRFSIRS
jgi:hypothetical protein